MTDEKTIRAEIVAELLTVHRYTEQDFHNRYALDSRTLRLLIWEAVEELTNVHGIVFGPVKGWPGVHERKQWDQIEARAKRQRAAGTRKHRRAERKLRIAAGLAPAAAQDRINDAADRVLLRMAMQHARKT